MIDHCLFRSPSSGCSRKLPVKIFEGLSGVQSGQTIRIRSTIAAVSSRRLSSREAAAALVAKAFDHSGECNTSHDSLQKAYYLASRSNAAFSRPIWRSTALCCRTRSGSGLCIVASSRRTRSSRPSERSIRSAAARAAGPWCPRGAVAERELHLRLFLVGLGERHLASSRRGEAAARRRAASAASLTACFRWRRRAPRSDRASWIPAAPDRRDNSRFPRPGHAFLEQAGKGREFASFSLKKPARAVSRLLGHDATPYIFLSLIIVLHPPCRGPPRTHLRDIVSAAMPQSSRKHVQPVKSGAKPHETKKGAAVAGGSR